MGASGLERQTRPADPAVIMDAIFSWINQYGYIAIFVSMMFGIVGLPVPDELLLTFLGYLVFKQVLSPIPTYCVAVSGSACGITTSYLLGRTFGFPLVERYGHFVNLKIGRVHQVRRWFDRGGKWTLTVGYFFPGIRHFTGFVAGTSRLRRRVFAAYAYLGACLWALVFISLGFLLGETWPAISAVWDEVAPTMHLWLMVTSILFLALIGGFLLLRQKIVKALRPLIHHGL